MIPNRPSDRWDKRDALNCNRRALNRKPRLMGSRLDHAGAAPYPSAVRVLVTGAFGFLGLALLRRLAPEHDLVATGHPPRNPMARATIPAGVELREGELLELKLEGRFDAVIHLAGGGGGARMATDPARAVRTNILGSQRLLELAREAGAGRLLFASTIAVYGTQRGGLFRETDATHGDDLYGAVKEAAERLWTAQGGHALRLANLYGAGCGIDLGIEGAAERFARAAARGGELTIYGGGAQKIDYLHIDDATDGFARALTAPSPPPILNLGGGAPVSIGALASACVSAAHKLDRTPRIVAKEAPAGKLWPDRSLANGRAASALGWQPQRRFQTGIDELVAMMARSQTPL